MLVTTITATEASTPSEGHSGLTFAGVLQALEAWRQELGLPPAAFAAHLGLSPAQWTATTRHHQALTLPVLCRLLQARPDLVPAFIRDVLGAAEGLEQVAEATSARRQARCARGVPLPGLRAARYRRGLSQLQLARFAGVEPKTIYLLETRAQTARPGTLWKLAAALRVEPADLMAAGPIPPTERRSA